MSDQADILRKVCQLLREQDTAQAATLARAEYPFVAREATKRAPANPEPIESSCATATWIATAANDWSARVR